MNYFKINLYSVMICVLSLLLLGCEKSKNLSDTINNLSEQSIESETNVTESNALSVAKIFMKSNVKHNGTKSLFSKADVKVVYNKCNEPLLYIINYNDGGFVIVSATKKYHPILAYSDEGCFEYNDDILINNSWLNETSIALQSCDLLSDSTKSVIERSWNNYETLNNTTLSQSTKVSDQEMEMRFQERIEMLSKELGEGYSFYRLSEVFDSFDFQDTEEAYQHYCDMARDIDSPLEYTLVVVKGVILNSMVGPLISTQWYNDGGFNAMCPEKPSCGVIAIAQLTTFHKHPSKYLWEQMENNSPNPSSQILIKDIQDYIGINSYGSNKDDEKRALDSLGYNCDYVPHNKNLAFNEIYNKRRPMLMRGDTTTVQDPTMPGHIWVCDGVDSRTYASSYFIEFFYKNDYNYLEFAPSMQNPNIVKGAGGATIYFHMNWGWGKYSATPNGWYLSNDVNTHIGNYIYDRHDYYITKK